MATETLDAHHPYAKDTTTNTPLEDARDRSRKRGYEMRRMLKRTITANAGRKDEEGEGRRRMETTVYGWWKGYGGGNGGMGESRTQHIYTSVFSPTALLGIGARVRLVALAKDSRAQSGATLDHYDPYDPHVVGEITELEQTGKGRARLTIRNKCRGNGVEEVVLEMPYNPDEVLRLTQLARKNDNEDGKAMEEDRQADVGDPRRRCRAEECLLKASTEQVTRTFRARPLRRGDGENRDLKEAGEGTLAMHLWMRYDYAK